MIPFFKKNYDERSTSRVLEVIKSGFLTSGEVGVNVESQLKSFFSVTDAVLCNSWTSCWELVLAFHKIGPGDEVIMPSMTFVSCANAVVSRGATVVFCDICPDELVVTAKTLRPHISKKTKLVLVVHMYGLMADMPLILDECKEIPVYEDAAHCFEGSRRDIKPGAYSSGAMFSFYATKNISCGEGGALVSNNLELTEFVRVNRLHGMSKTAIDRYTDPIYQHWDVLSPGKKYNLPDILAALLPEQIENCLVVQKLRADAHKFYLNAFSNIDSNINIKMQKNPPEVKHAHHLFAICVDREKRDPLLKYFGENGIGVAVNFRDIPSLSYYNGHNRPVVAHEWGAGTISLPFHPGISEDEMVQVVNLTDKFFSKGKN